MKYLFLIIIAFCSASLMAQGTFEEYPVDSASLVQPGVPKGEILKFTFDQSKIFPGTWREYWVYVPAQYDPQRPACVYVNQDGIQWNAPTVFDNLIHQKEMPVTIGVFVTPGRVLSQKPDEALDRFNRSFEYDGLGDAYARFILDEILPEVEKQKTSDGRAIVLSKNGNDRAIGGSSSGAVCAFTAAWERPDAFSRVFSAIGTYVGLRGADRYPTLIRKYEPKPLRIFLQDGENDLNIYAGDWWMANQTILRALTFAGYEVDHVWGTGAHNGRHGSAIFPEAMRYLWKGWPTPIEAGASKNQMFTEVLIPNVDWEPMGEMIKGYDKIGITTAGDVYFQNAKGKKASGFGADGKLAELDSLPPIPVRPKLVGNPGIKVGGATLSPDQTQLYATDAASHWVWVYQVQPDGTFRYGQRYGWLHAPDTADNAGATDVVCDRDGRVYVATALGVQVLDQTGRVNLIIPTPEEKADHVVLGGPEFNELYVAAGGKIYRRKLKVRGSNSFEAPVKPAKPKL
ncbi:alpha/beta hydrolase-fold protein [Salmonirosea aquatica]|uniref:Esterase n=1 Tax=Salmonirosea aquatica TaxID=2654236 RepID=A0A7C9FFV8_9BACT|nr:esterase [Cytophagaceae bacterium SJW1-29]